MHGLSIFCHFWQIADHTHIFSLPLPHKLWLHMGKHSLPQECSKLQRMPHTHSRASHMEFHHMVSTPAVFIVALSEGHPYMYESIRAVLLKDYLGPLQKGLSPSVSEFLVWLFLMSTVGTCCYLSWGQRWQIDCMVHRPSLLFFPIYISTSNLPFEYLALKFKVFCAYLW